MTSESAVQQKLTKAFIDDNPTDIVLYRGGVVDDGQGGQTRVPPSPLPSQRVRVVESGLVSSNAARLIPGVDISEVDATVVGFISLDIKRGDSFTYQGKRYTVSTEPKQIQDWSKSAGVTTNG